MLVKHFVELRKREKKITKSELADKLWPGRSKVTQQVNLSNLLSGRTGGNIDFIVNTICKELDISPNQLFDYEK